MVVLENLSQRDIVNNIFVCTIYNTIHSLILDNKKDSKIKAIINLFVDCVRHAKNMSSIPQGMFCSIKIRENRDKLVVARKTSGDNNSSHKYYNTKLMELTPLKYNSKLMNSIWGLYNRYSPHNIKKTTDVTFKATGDLHEYYADLPKIAVSKEAADGVGKISNKPQPQNVPKIWSNIPISQ